MRTASTVSFLADEALEMTHERSCGDSRNGAQEQSQDSLHSELERERERGRGESDSYALSLLSSR